LSTMLLYNIHHEESFGAFIALYIFFTGLSAGSFLLSTLAYGFGMVRFRAVSRPAIIVATLMLMIAPLFLLVHVGRPLRSWHLFFYLNPASPITWGSFLLTAYPLFCLIYMYCIFREKTRAARFWGLLGIPFAISVHAYTGFILSFCSARPMWNSSMIPLLFLVSAVVSGTALVILVYSGWCRWQGREISAGSESGDLILSLAKLLGWVLVLDLFMTGIDVLVASVSGAESRWAVRELLSGELALHFVGIEIVLGKLVPLPLLLLPRFRKPVFIFLACALIILGILFMRLDLVKVGELAPLL
jgi:tetrathionate reductase subunit C